MIKMTLRLIELTRRERYTREHVTLLPTCARAAPLCALLRERYAAALIHFRQRRRYVWCRYARFVIVAVYAVTPRRHESICYAHAVTLVTPLLLLCYWRCCLQVATMPE